MSETTAPDTLQNLQVSKGEISRLNGGNTPTTIVQWGPPEKRRRVEFRELKLSDQWKVARITDEGSSCQWRMMTLIALSLEQIDNLPCIPFKATINLAEVEERLDRLGEDGFEAVARASAPPEVEADGGEALDPEAAHRAQVGNSSGPAASAA